MLDLGDATERVRILPHQRQEFVQQVAERHQRPFAEIEQRAVYAIALRTPAVLGEKEQRVRAPRLVGPADAVEHAHDGHEQGCHGHRIFHVRADIRDAHLERRKARRGAQIPPDLGRILDDAGPHQHIDGARILLPAVEPLGQARPRQLLEGREPVALEARVEPFGKGRGRRQHQEVRQEIAGLVHEVDAQFVVLDPDMHVHAADHHAPRHAGEVLRQ